MPRKKRIWYLGAKYHITSRGIRRTTLFHEDVDRLDYMKILEETMNRTPFILHTYCLMTNHIHLQIETLQSPPGKIMKHFHLTYAKYFNQKYHYTGHVFESGYGAEVIDSVEYELDVNKYIHLNPLQANMVNRIEDYKWSSYADYVNQTSTSLVTTKRILTFFREPKSEHYKKFLYANVKDTGKHLKETMK